MKTGCQKEAVSLFDNLTKRAASSPACFTPEKKEGEHLVKQVKLEWKNGIPAVLAILVFLVAERIGLLEMAPLEQWGKVDTFPY